MTPSSWDARIHRAEELAKKYEFAAEVLNFYKEIATFQKALYTDLQSAYGPKTQNRRIGSLREQLDLALLLPRFPSLLSLVERVGPPPLAQLAGELAQQGQDPWISFLAAYWTTNGKGETVTQDDAAIFFARAFLQPYAEYLADHTEKLWDKYRQPTCPLCGRKPQVGVLRPEGHGAKRSLICSLCSTEWDYRRIACPACGEVGFDELPIYTVSEFEHVRVEACDTCKSYIKTVDLTKNGLAVPIVDELATIPLNLWAQEKGYKKVEPNLVGI